jgi:hypothetical protein
LKNITKPLLFVPYTQAVWLFLHNKFKKNQLPGIEAFFSHSGQYNILSAAGIAA